MTKKKKEKKLQEKICWATEAPDQLKLGIKNMGQVLRSGNHTRDDTKIY